MISDIEKAKIFNRKEANARKALAEYYEKQSKEGGIMTEEQALEILKDKEKRATHLEVQTAMNILVKVINPSAGAVNGNKPQETPKVA